MKIIREIFDATSSILWTVAFIAALNNFSTPRTITYYSLTTELMP